MRFRQQFLRAGLTRQARSLKRVGDLSFWQNILGGGLGQTVSAQAGDESTSGGQTPPLSSHPIGTKHDTTRQSGCAGRMPEGAI